MNLSKFFDAETNQRIKILLKSKNITLDDVRLLAKSELYSTFNFIVNSFECRGITTSTDSIIYRDTMEAILSIYNIRFDCFHKLLNTGYIDSCGRGYTLNYSKRLELSEAEYNRLLVLIYDYELLTA